MSEDDFATKHKGALTAGKVLGLLTFSTYKQWKEKGWEGLFAARHFSPSICLLFLDYFPDIPSIPIIVSSEDENSSPIASKSSSKYAHNKPLSMGSVASELLASNSQLLKVSQEANKARLEILQAKQDREERRLRLEEEKFRSDIELKEKELKVKQAQEIIANPNALPELKKKASDFLMTYFSF
ncbi:hypothetical protein APHAL10511_003883 [Amanita phalloides]|nr:hypothetical protein APHAL10511_003883 [Amanita phalloides]